MSIETIFAVTLILSTLLCTLVAGFLFAFAVVIMPGIRHMKDREFVRGFQVIDGVIQDNQPVFVLVWVGSVLTLLTSAALGFGQLVGGELVIMILATLLYFIGVQLPTIVVNVPLNNALQAVDVDVVDEAALKTARERFEPRWNQWNSARTVVATLASALLLLLLYSL